MSDYLPIAAGKTKMIFAVPGTTVVRVVSKSDLTAGNGMRHAVLPGKAELATTTTVAVFKLLRRHGVPVAFIGQSGPDEFRAEHCTMFPLEIVVRRFAQGSYLRRNPRVPDGIRINGPSVEFFLKTTRRTFRDIQFPVDDPIILEYNEKHLITARPDIPYDSDPVLVPVSKMPWPDDSIYDVFEHLRLLARRVFTILEESWAELGCTLQDLKIEVGLDAADVLVVADVIDGDSWRLIDLAGNHLDKQPFRDGAPIEDVGRIYKKIAEMAVLLK